MNITLGALDNNKTYQVYALTGPLVYSTIAVESILKESMPQRTRDELVAMRDKIVEWRRQVGVFYSAMLSDNSKQAYWSEGDELIAAATESIAAFDKGIAAFRSEPSYRVYPNDAPVVKAEPTKSMLPLAIAGVAAFLLLKG